MENKASEMFWDAFIDGGSIVIQCSCGRTHFSNREDAGDWEDGELEELLKNQSLFPDKYISTSDDAVATAYINGNILCYNCPCGMDAKYERFILDNESEIIKYYKMKAKEQWRVACETSGRLEGL